ncbi:MAG: hypothetical protein RMJ44_01555, partial [Cytophagales bacterium]|nr:hypothetical protein [Bernardetiaceae bacterium]MDW8209747.1 hypothetical protein [Cytophagales bacterium]
ADGTAVTGGRVGRRQTSPKSPPKEGSVFLSLQKTLPYLTSCIVSLQKHPIIKFQKVFFCPTFFASACQLFKQ